jgi:superfamily II DNA or RNA helicase
MSAPRVVRLRFDAGTLLLHGLGRDALPPGVLWDERVGLGRAPAALYHDLVLRLRDDGATLQDEARAYAPLQRAHHAPRTPRPYQREAVDAWRAAGRRGVIILPTGAGKSFVAELCIAAADRDALVIAPTLDLVGQWYDQLVRAFGEPVGILGGGHHELAPITVATYDSALAHVDRYGDRFGLLVCDEVHHLAGASYRRIALGSLAPFRLGLTATLERPDGQHHVIADLLGPVVYRREITELSGEFLAPYRTEVVRVHLSAADRRAYEDAEANWRGFVAEQGIKLAGANGFSAFLGACARSARGREAHAAFRRSRSITDGAPAKLRVLSELLRRHKGSRTLIFTNDNATVYEISRSLLLPAITHQTDIKERRALLRAFADGSLPTLVTSKVLNEGVDVPAAEIAVVLSGTSTVREHVQRLGRILRPREGKQAVLYELVAVDTRDERTSARRREHAAYGGQPSLRDAED